MLSFYINICLIFSISFPCRIFQFLIIFALVSTAQSHYDSAVLIRCPW